MKKSNIIRKYDSKNRLVYELVDNTNEIIIKYDENNNITYKKDWNIKSGEIWIEFIAEYDSKNNLIHYNDSENMNEYWIEYDEQNRIKSKKWNTGEASIYEYDEKGKLKYQLNENGIIEIEYTNEYED